MEIKIDFKTDDAINLFEYYNFSIEKDTEKKQMFVVNPHNNKKIDLAAAMQRLIQKKISRDFFCIDKMSLIEVLNNI